MEPIEYQNTKNFVVVLRKKIRYFKENKEKMTFIPLDFLSVISFILDNYNLFNDCSLFCSHPFSYNNEKFKPCQECIYNMYFFLGFKRLVFTARDKKNNFKKDFYLLIEKYIEKNFDLISFYIDFATEEKDIYIIFKNLTKKNLSKCSHKISEDIYCGIEKKCKNNFNICKIYYKYSKKFLTKSNSLLIIKLLFEFKIIEFLYIHQRAKKIQRWFKNIRYKPSIYPAGERMALRQLEKEGLDDIFN